MASINSNTLNYRNYLFSVACHVPNSACHVLNIYHNRLKRFNHNGFFWFISCLFYGWFIKKFSVKSKIIYIIIIYINYIKKIWCYIMKTLELFMYLDQNPECKSLKDISIKAKISYPTLLEGIKILKKTGYITTSGKREKKIQKTQLWHDNRHTLQKFIKEVLK